MASIETPALVVDIRRLRSNIERCQGLLDSAGMRNRPHVKTHRSTRIAKLQLAAGARGITCQKLSEAEVMVEAGIDDILVPYNIVGRYKLARLRDLLGRARVAVSIDDERLVEGLVSVAREAGTPLATHVECDVGYGRTGVASPREAAELARVVAASDLEFAGFVAYPAPASAKALLEDAVATADSLGVTCATRSLGGTTGLAQAASLAPIVNEYRPGVYVFNDWNTVAAGAATVDDCALTVRATVVSVARSGRAVLDTGSKALAAEADANGAFGHVVEAPRSTLERLSEEHGEVALAAGERLELGQTVSVIPNHACVVVNLFDTLTIVEDEDVVDEWRIDARGRSL